MIRNCVGLIWIFRINLSGLYGKSKFAFLLGFVGREGRGCTARTKRTKTGSIDGITRDREAKRQPRKSGCQKMQRVLQECGRTGGWVDPLYLFSFAVQPSLSSHRSAAVIYYSLRFLLLLNTADLQIPHESPPIRIIPPNPPLIRLILRRRYNPHFPRNSLHRS